MQLFSPPSCQAAAPEGVSCSTLSYNAGVGPPPSCELAGPLVTSGLPHPPKFARVRALWRLVYTLDPPCVDGCCRCRFSGVGSASLWGAYDREGSEAAPTSGVQYFRNGSSSGGCAPRAGYLFVYEVRPWEKPTSTASRIWPSGSSSGRTRSSSRCVNRRVCGSTPAPLKLRPPIPAGFVTRRVSTATAAAHWRLAR